MTDSSVNLFLCREYLRKRQRAWTGGVAMPDTARAPILRAAKW